MQDFFSPLSDFFFWILRFLHENVGVSWSWAIVVLTVIVRVVLIPLTWRQIKSMRAMQALQPQMKLLQEKYRDDRQVLNQKMMEFYRENSVSPFGSCLPLLLQMPVFLGLFYMLKDAGGVNNYIDAGAFASVWHSLPVGWLWIGDITKFDIVLMFLYIASQFVASWQMARKGAGQQKIIAYVMPVMIGIFMYIYRWPAGLFIYWCTSNLWTIAQQFVLEKVVPAPVPVSVTPAKGAKPAPTGPAGKTPAKTSAKPSAKSSGKIPAKAPGKTTAPAKQKTTPTQPAGRTSVKPPGKSGGKTSGQKTGQQGKAAGGKGRRTDGGTGGPKSSGGT
jgi:YidC/Oxa1 family membrane protein insertase